MKKRFFYVAILSLLSLISFGQGGFTPIPKLKITTTPETNNSTTEVLVRDATTGNVGKVAKSSLAGTLDSVTDAGANTTNAISTGGVGINTTTPQALFDVVSTSSGILIPRLTTSQRDAIVSPSTSELIYNSTNGRFEFFDGIDWTFIGGSTSTPTLQGVTEENPSLTTRIEFEGDPSATFASSLNQIIIGAGDDYNLDEVAQRTSLISFSTSENTNIARLATQDVPNSLIAYVEARTNETAENPNHKSVVIIFANTDSAGLTGAFDYTPNIGDLDYTQKIYVDAKIISSNETAKNDRNYSVVANATFTDPTPVEGKGYMVTVINGTATIGGVGYTVGQKVFRHFHSGSWRTFVTQNASSLSKIVIKDTTSSAPVTGSTLNTLAKTYEIQGGVFDENDAFNLEVNAEKTGVNGTSTIRVYVNTTNNFATATLYSTTASASASIRDIPVSRLRSNFKGTNLIVVAPGSGLLTDLAQGFNSPRTALSLNPANTFFIFVAIQNANAGDSTTIESVHLTT